MLLNMLVNSKLKFYLPNRESRLTKTMSKQCWVKIVKKEERSNLSILLENFSRKHFLNRKESSKLQVLTEKKNSHAFGNHLNIAEFAEIAKKTFAISRFSAEIIINNFYICFQSANVLLHIPKSAKTVEMPNIIDIFWQKAWYLASPCNYFYVKVKLLRFFVFTPSKQDIKR